ncbi:MAG: penicillin acylase family protein [Bacteroidota bacterium]
MKKLRFVIAFAISLTVLIALDNSFSGLPALGSFLSPHHGFWQNGEPLGKRPPQEMNLKGLKGPVKVYYDTLKIPHIYAENSHDLYMIMGYIAAKDRLWQMDFYSRVVFGRLSEVLGDRALSYDRLQRRTGLKAMTTAMYELIRENSGINEMLEAYSQGVNSYIDELDYASYPIEFKLLDYDPEPWTPLKTCMAYGLLSNTLSRGEADLENTNALEIFGEDLFNILYPEMPKDLDPVIPKGTPWNFQPLEVMTKLQALHGTIISKTIEKPDPLNGSNNFAVSPAKSATGNILFANEPDLQLTLPSIWHASHLHAPGINVMGVTVPGTPVILIGFNDSITWGVTNSPRDQVDWYQIEFRNSEREEYSYNNQWFKTSKVIEKFEVKGENDFYDTIVHVHHGPVVYDRNYLPENGKFNAAMRWIAHDKSTTFQTMYEINKARNYSEFINALKSFTGPPQNFAFGSAEGIIAMELPGKFPVKKIGQGKFLLDGSDPESESKLYIPFEQRLKIVNPKREFVSSANQHQVDSLYPYYVYDNHYEHDRNRRINDRLSILPKVTPNDMKKLQNDNFNYRASEMLPVMLDTLDTLSFHDQHWKYFNMLASWDYFNEPELIVPTVYQIWWNLLYKSVWDEFDTITVAIDKPGQHHTTELLRYMPEFEMLDRLETPEKENAIDLYQYTFQQTVDSVSALQEAGEDLRWYIFKNTSVNHLLRLAPFSVESIRVGGFGNTVNAAAGGHGPSWRMVVEVTKQGPNAWGVYPGSQTGNPGNPEYGHMIENWATGNYYSLVFGSDVSANPDIVFTQEINPE